MSSLGQDLTHCTDEKRENLRDAAFPITGSLGPRQLWIFVLPQTVSVTSLQIFFLTALFTAKLLYVTQELLAHVGFTVISNAQNNKCLTVLTCCRVSIRIEHCETTFL